MTREQILEKVTDIFKDIIDNDDIVLTDDTVAADVEDWDSLNHMQIIAGIEKTFRFKFSSTEIYQFKNVGGLIDAIATRVNA